MGQNVSLHPVKNDGEKKSGTSIIKQSRIKIKGMREILRKILPKEGKKVKFIGRRDDIIYKIERNIHREVYYIKFARILGTERLTIVEKE